MGTGVGSERPITGATGIYAEPPSEYDEEEELDTFVSKLAAKINKTRLRIDPSRRADRDKFASGNHPINPVSENLPGIRGGISPFSSRTLFPKGLDGPPIGTGNAGQAFRTTGNFIGKGTQFGSSRAQIDNYEDENSDEEMLVYSMDDIIEPDIKAVLRQRLKIHRLLHKMDSLLS